MENCITLSMNYLFRTIKNLNLSRVPETSKFWIFLSSARLTPTFPSVHFSVSLILKNNKLSKEENSEVEEFSGIQVKRYIHV